SRLTGHIFDESTGREYKQVLSDNHQKLWILNNKYGLMAHDQFEFKGKDMNIIFEEFKTHLLNGYDSLFLAAYKLFDFNIKNYPTHDTHFWLSGIENSNPTIFHINENKLKVKNIVKGEIHYGFYFGGNKLGADIEKKFIEYKG